MLEHWHVIALHSDTGTPILIPRVSHLTSPWSEGLSLLAPGGSETRDPGNEVVVLKGRVHVWCPSTGIRTPAQNSAAFRHWYVLQVPKYHPGFEYKVDTLYLDTGTVQNGVCFGDFLPTRTLCDAYHKEFESN